MGVLDWLRRGSRDGDQLRAWRNAWTDAVGCHDASAPERLRRALEEMPGSSDDREIELEMLEGLEQLMTLRERLATAQLPIVDTGHRVVGLDACHFSEPVSIPDDPAQPSGRLLLTSTRAVFVGGRLIGIPWHAARQVAHADRDVLLVRVSADEAIRFRCNSYGDALRAAELARYLIARARTRKESNPQ